MGMFDYVKYKANCRKCGEPLSDFQSTSALDGEDLMRMLKPKDVGNFYTNCDKCDTWNEFKVVPQSIKIVHTAKIIN